MKGKLSLMLLLITAVSFTACKKFLQEQTQDQLVPKTTRDFSELLFGDGYPRTLDPMLIAPTLMDDDVSNTTNASFGNSLSFIQTAQTVLPMYSWQPDQYEKLMAGGAVGLKEYNTWYVFYSKISACNVALQYADGAVGTQADKDYLKGEAYALRAFYYFNLVNLYGLPYNTVGSDRTKNPAVPIILTSDYSSGKLYTRNTVEEVYKQIVADIEAAVALLDQEKRIPNMYRINFKAAHLLASRIYLHMEQWDKVIAHATAALNAQSGLMQLNGWGTIDPTGKPIVGAANMETYWAYGSTSYLGLVKIGQGSGSGYYVVAPDLVSQFATDDLRRTVYVKPHATGAFSYGGDNQKWPNIYSTTAQPHGKCFRVSEAYLNRAEAYIQQYKQGNTAAGQSAVDDLNTLRRNRINTATYVDWTLTGADQLLLDCRNERRRELFWEDQRWFDLRRYGMPSIEHLFYEGTALRFKYTLEEKDPSYVLPIPRIVLNQNNALIQNPLAPERPGVAF